MDSIFEFFFKYRPLLFQRGEFTFASGWSVWMLLVTFIAVAAPVLWLYARARGHTRKRDRGILMGLRLAILALVLFCLMKPTLLVKRVLPQQSYVAVLLDDSRSMRIADDDDKPRTE